MTVPASREEIVSGLAEVLEEVAGTPADKVTPEAAFDKDLDVDSLTMVEVVVACESFTPDAGPPAILSRSCARRS